MSDPVLTGQIEYYRARAAEYDSWFNRTGRYDRGETVNRAWFTEVDEVKADLDRLALDDAHVLELAPGTGIWTEQLAKRARRVTAVDASPEMIGINRARLADDVSRVDYVIADLFAWEPEQSYDAVVFCFWISHIPDRLLDGFLAKVAQALRPGGTVFFLDAQRESDSLAADHVLPEPDQEVMTRRLDDGREFTIVKNFWEPADLERRCGAVGMDVEVRQTAQFFQYGVGTRPRPSSPT